MEEKKMPVKFEERMRRLLGDEFDDFQKALLEEDNIRSLRVNRNKISVEDFLRLAPYELEPIPYNFEGFYLKDDVQMGGEVCHQAGMFYMQEPAAMMPISAIDIAPDWCVLDLCAAPGGKTTQIANFISDDGLIVSNDFKFDRCKALVENIERIGLRNTIITSGSVAEVCSNFENFFDLIVVDATCSGEGMFRKNVNIMNYWSETSVKNKAAIQRELLAGVVRSLKGDGLLVYSTCTYSLEENEEMVGWFLDNYPEFSLVDAKEAVVKATSPGVRIDDRYDYTKTRRFYLHKGKGEGQFVAILKRTASVGEARVIERKNKTSPMDLKVVETFLKETGLDAVVDTEQIYIRNNVVWVLPKQNYLIKKHAVNNGVRMGTIEPNMTLTPDHAFFMAYGSFMNGQVAFEIDDPRLDRYLSGYDITYSCPDGYGAILAGNCTIGGYYARRGNLKNLYPKNLTNKEFI